MTKLTMWNNTDLDMAAQGLIPREAVRSVELEALVDTGATMLMIPQEAADVLGLPTIDRLPVTLADSSVRSLAVAGSLKIAILSRGMVCDALVAPAGATALIGQLQLERLDLIVDPKSREVRVNPASPDAPLLDAMRAA